MAGVILTAYSLICISEKKLSYRRFPIEITGITFHVIITIILLVGIFFLIRGIKDLLS
jgi:hypothetical protein